MGKLKVSKDGNEVYAIIERDFGKWFVVWLKGQTRALIAEIVNSLNEPTFGDLVDDFFDGLEDFIKMELNE